MQGGITYAKSGCQEIGRICYGSNFCRWYAGDIGTAIRCCDNKFSGKEGVLFQGI